MNTSTNDPAWSRFLAGLPSSRPAAWILTFLIVLLCLSANLPWQLDNYDQAKQAYVAYEIAHGGDALFQHTPRGGVATKPPLAGWISLSVYWVIGSWDWAWRLPGLLCTAWLLYLLAREAARLWPGGGATLAASAFALNLMTPRIASLVRTDMMLTLWISFCGLLIYSRVASGTAWNLNSRLAFCAVMTAALFTKGPIIYAFLLPGMVAFLFLADKSRRRLIWSGWWTWLIPLGVFALWGGIGLATRPEFYREVVVEEFFSRFDQSLKSHERQQPIWFYFPHLIHKWLPWSLLALALPAFSANVRKALRERPELLWLACWAVGGLLCMTLVPSKRVDRIFPVIPPLVLLLTGMVAACRCGPRIRAWCGACIIIAAIFSTAYFAGVVWIGYSEGYGKFRRFGEEAAQRARAHRDGRLAVVDGKDEGLVMYAEVASTTPAARAIREFQEGRLDVLLIPRRRLPEGTQLPEPAMTSGRSPNGEEYLLILAP
ncbi:MAG: hypothetical protein Fur0032_11800 [Terrimicrobiaceae bacterium]